MGLDVPDQQTIVLKIGGSLFDLPDLGFRVQKLISHNEIHQPLLMSGGGEAANLVRKWDKIYDLPEEKSHDLAVEALSLNEQLLLHLVPETVLVHNREEAGKAWGQNQVPILNCSHFLKEEEPKQDSSILPHHWGVTSDSIAAWVTIHWPADALILLKSISIHSMDLHDQSEYVDPEFNQFVPKLAKIGWCNLRSSNPELFYLNEHG
jgi:5-(aminomethyl)-3-furanmethanol phosphate kinase